MLQQTIQLEQLRRKIEDAEFAIGDQSDYLDLGKPNAQQAKSAQETISRMKGKSQELQAALHETIATVRRENPEALQEWVNYHKNILERIIAEPTSNTHTKVRQNVARETLQQWEKVLSGEQEYVNINWHYLKDYKAEAKKLGKTAWWKFW
ncbi:MAG: hypothetical protein QM730_16760 [Anaerolineales bacterium]